MSASRTIPTMLVVVLPVLAAIPALAGAQANALDDAQIAHIAVTANAIDAELAEVARGRATNQQVREFAETMKRDHTAVNEQAVALATRLGVTPADNDVSRSLRGGADVARRELEKVRGSDFDVAYMQREVEYHEVVLQVLDETLIPNTRNVELKALLQQARAAVAAHLEHARHLRGALSASR